jgi:DNA-binding CsgD family transcriptional regulator
MGKTIAFRRATEAIAHMADPAPPWNDILTTARDLVGADAATLLMFDKAQHLLMAHQIGIDQAAEQEYRQHFYKEDTLAKAAMAAPAGIWLDSTQILPANVIYKNAFHADYLPRSRIGQILAFTVHKDGFEQTGLSFQRVTPQAEATKSLTHGEVAAYMHAFMQELAQRRQASLARLEAIESTFASLNEATLLVTQRGLIWRLSPLAKQSLRAAKMISSDGASITHTDPIMMQRLQTALAKAAASCAGTAVTMPLAWGEAYRLDISPAHASVKLGNENIFFIRLRKHSAFNLPDVQELCAHFGITPAEGRILLALVAGHAPNEIASVSGVAERTVRNQIASLMQKMDCSRQSELVRLASLLQ